MIGESRIDLPRLPITFHLSPFTLCSCRTWDPLPIRLRAHPLRSGFWLLLQGSGASRELVEGLRMTAIENLHSNPLRSGREHVTKEKGHASGVPLFESVAAARLVGARRTSSRSGLLRCGRVRYRRLMRRSSR